jgi:hypothetical protein
MDSQQNRCENLQSRSVLENGGSGKHFTYKFIQRSKVKAGFMYSSHGVLKVLATDDVFKFYSKRKFLFLK